MEGCNAHRNRVNDPPMLGLELHEGTPATAGASDRQQQPDVAAVVVVVAAAAPAPAPALP